MENKAKIFAVSRHQFYSHMYDGYPYTKHLEMVVSIARKYLGYIDIHDRDNVLSSCWCHDLIEDTDVSKIQISEYLGCSVAEIVSAVTNEDADSRDVRNILTYGKIGKNNLAVYVKLCDRIANTKNSKQYARVIYNKYKSEFPLFRHFLQNGGMLYHNMWKELEGLY